MPESHIQKQKYSGKLAGQHSIDSIILPIYIKKNSTVEKNSTVDWQDTVNQL